MTSETIRDPVKDQLLTPQNSALLIIDYQPVQVNSIVSMDRQKLIDIDALHAGYEVYVVADAVGGTSVEAHQAALRRIEQAGGKMISLMQLICELQRDWGRKETVPAFVKVASEIPGTFAIQLAYDSDMATDG